MSTRLLGQWRVGRAGLLVTTRSVCLTWQTSPTVSQGLLLLWRHPPGWARYTLTHTPAESP